MELEMCWSLSWPLFAHCRCDSDGNCLGYIFKTTRECVTISNGANNQEISAADEEGEVFVKGLVCLIVLQVV